MTIAAPAECWWRPEDGAPAGPGFDLMIPSSRRGHRPYRIARDAAHGSIVHYPLCLAWVHDGPRVCSHVRAAITQAEQPAAAFLALVRDTMSTSTYWANPAEAERVLHVIKRAMEDAERQIDENASVARAAAEWAALTDDQKAEEAVAMFGTKPGEGRRGR